MCKFFSFLIAPSTEIFFHDAKQRKKLLRQGINPDSHAYIAKTYGLNEDKCIKFEYTPGAVGVVVDHCPEWAREHRDGEIKSQYLDQATRFATTFDFRRISTRWPENYKELHTMKSVCKITSRQLPRAVMRAFPNCTKSWTQSVHRVIDFLGRPEQYIVELVQNIDSCIANVLDELRAVRELGWLDTVYRPGTKLRKHIDDMLLLIDHGLRPVVERRKGKDGKVRWVVYSALKNERYVVTAAGSMRKERGICG